MPQGSAALAAGCQLADQKKVGAGVTSRIQCIRAMVESGFGINSDFQAFSWDADHASDFIYRAAFSGISVQTGLKQFDRNRCLQNDSIQLTPDFIEGNTAVCVFCSAQFKNKHMK
jgi:hypothetical protein